MRIRVELVIEVDPESWDRTYGNGARRSDVREDVREYVLDAIQQSAAAQETGMTARLSGT